VGVASADTAYQAHVLQERYQAEGRLPLVSTRERDPHQDTGVQVRRIVHGLRSRAIENFTGQGKAIVDCQGQVPTRTLRATQRFVLGAVFVYHLVLLSRLQAGPHLRVGLKPFVQAA